MQIMIKNSMKYCQRLIPIVLGILLISCSQRTPAENPNITVSPTPTIVNNLAQELPISAVALMPNGTEIKLEVARTPKQQAMGLMYKIGRASCRERV